MEYRRLGRTDLRVSSIGLGCEHVEHTPTEEVKQVIHTAIDQGINYFDLILSGPEPRSNYGHAFKGRVRQDLILGGHMSFVQQDGQVRTTRDPKLCQESLEDLLDRLATDYLDILMLSYVDEDEDYKRVLGNEGLICLAERLKEQGKVRYIGLSSHRTPTALRAVQSGAIDLLMFPINPAFDLLPGHMGLEALWEADPYCQAQTGVLRQDRRELYWACLAHDVGLVAMKPYAAGWLFYKENSSSISMTPVQCLHYALSQPGVSTVIPGCKNLDQLQAALGYLHARKEEKDFQSIGHHWNLDGVCYYCNHCLPCPQGIDIGRITQLLDTGRQQMTESMRFQYQAAPVLASSCTQCGHCQTLCPFGVDIPENMRAAASLFEQNIKTP